MDCRINLYQDSHPPVLWPEGREYQFFAGGHMDGVGMRAVKKAVVDSASAFSITKLLRFESLSKWVSDPLISTF